VTAPPVGPLLGVAPLTGDPDVLAAVGIALDAFAGQAAALARGLGEGPPGGWAGEAAAALDPELGRLPGRLGAAATAFSEAAAAVEAHVQVLRAAQPVARQAARLHAQAADATTAWLRQRTAGPLGAGTGPRALLPDALGTDATPGPADDPGRADRACAVALLAGAQAEVARSGRRLAAVLRRTTALAPPEPCALLRLWRAGGRFDEGALMAGWDMAVGVYTMSPGYAAADPIGFARHEQELRRGLVYVGHRPVAAGEQLLDVETWRTDPARALGHLAPTAAITAASYGVGSVDAVDLTASRFTQLRQLATALREDGAVPPAPREPTGPVGMAVGVTKGLLPQAHQVPAAGARAARQEQQAGRPRRAPRASPTPSPEPEAPPAPRR
jgi:hypothetical protein